MHSASGGLPDVALGLMLVTHFLFGIVSSICNDDQFPVLVARVRVKAPVCECSHAAWLQTVSPRLLMAFLVQAGIVRERGPHRMLSPGRSAAMAPPQVPTLSGVEGLPQDTTVRIRYIWRGYYGR